jgi:hypothetical protein
MIRLYVTLIFAGICGAGLKYLLILRKRLEDRESKAALFLQHLQHFLGTRSVSSENYSWLMRHSVEMQAEMGALGVMGYRPAYERYVIPNWPIVLNGLPEMRRSLELDLSAGRAFDELGSMLQEAILRYAGTLEVQSGEMRRLLRSPIVWFRYGIQFLLLIPFMILRSLGLAIIPEDSVLQGQSTFRVLAAIAAIVTFCSSVVTIAAGWNAVSGFAKAVIGHLHK